MSGLFALFLGVGIGFPIGAIFGEHWTRRAYARKAASLETFFKNLGRN